MGAFFRLSPAVLLGALVGCSALVAAELDDKPTTVGDELSDAGPADDSAPDSAAESGLHPDQTVCEACSADSCCDSECVDLSANALHCGACGRACPIGRRCILGTCEGGWLSMSSQNQPSARAHACGVWIGTHAVIWGGMQLDTETVLGDGALYDPATDTWQPMDGTNAPSPRAMPLCVWTGTRMIVWGGADPSSGTVREDGALWSLAGGWAPMTDNNKPSGRVRPSAAWTGDKLIVWGGENLDGTGESSGAIYDPQNDTWTRMGTDNGPSYFIGSSAAWANDRFLVFGGSRSTNEATNSLRTYDPLTDSWTTLSPGGAPSSRSHAFSAWTGHNLILWGGWNKDKVPLSDAFMLAADFESWIKLEVGERPSARAAVPFDSGWTMLGQGQMMVFGGIGPTSGVQINGGRFDMLQSNWSVLPSWEPALEHRYGVGVWTGLEFVLWGGYDGAGPILGGSRWML